MKVYAISRDFTPEQLEAAASAEYPVQNGEWPFPRRTEDGDCPLGVALRAAGLRATDATGWAPGATLVANALIPHQEDPYELGRFAACARRARAFIRDWDSNKIPPSELRAAFGLEPR